MAGGMWQGYLIDGVVEDVVSQIETTQTVYNG